MPTIAVLPASVTLPTNGPAMVRDFILMPPVTAFTVAVYAVALEALSKTTSSWLLGTDAPEPPPDDVDQRAVSLQLPVPPTQ